MNETSNSNSIMSNTVEKTVGGGPTRSTYIFALCAALNSVSLGYDIGVSTAVGPLIKQYFNLEIFGQEVFISILDFFQIFGAIGSYLLADKLGRKANFATAAILFLVGIALQAAAFDYWLLLVGRSLVGIGAGIGFAIDPVYIAEMSPSHNRGFLVGFSEIGTNVGIVLGFSASLVFNGVDASIRWRYMLLCGAIPPIFMLLLIMFVMPESPRWLMARGKEEEARAVLGKVTSSSEDCHRVLEDMRYAVAYDKEVHREGTVGSWSSMLCSKSPAMRRALLVGVGAAIAQQAVGVDAIQAYLNTVLEQAGIPDGQLSNGIQLAIMFLKLLCTTLGTFLSDRKGRRPIYFISLVGTIVGLTTVSVGFFIAENASTPNPACVLVGIVLYWIFFSLGMGPLSWLIPSEVFSTCIRGKAMSLATSVNRFIGFVYGLTYVTVATAMGWGPFYLMIAVVCVIVFAFMYFFLPETNGKSLEEMNKHFAEVTGDTTVLDTEKKLRQRIQHGTADDTYAHGIVENDASTVVDGESSSSSKKDGQQQRCGV